MKEFYLKFLICFMPVYIILALIICIAYPFILQKCNLGIVGDFNVGCPEELHQRFEPDLL